MNINFHNTQFELFPHKVDSSNRHPRDRRLFATVTLSAENLVILSIFVLMLSIFFYSLGVEKGRRIGGLAYGTDSHVGHAIAAAIDSPSDIRSATGGVPSAPSSPVPVQEIKSFTEYDEHSTIASSQPKVPDVISDALGRYTIQVASFKTEQYARKEAEGLRSRVDHEVIILPKGSYSIVCVGRFPDRTMAEMVGKTLKRYYKDYLVRRL